MIFQHLVVQGPTHYKEQIERLQIAVFNESQPKPAPGRLGRLSAKTEAMLADEVAEITGFAKEYCRTSLSHFLERPETYGIKSIIVNRRRAYMSI